MNNLLLTDVLGSLVEAAVEGRNTMRWYTGPGLVLPWPEEIKMELDFLVPASAQAIHTPKQRRAGVPGHT